MNNIRILRVQHNLSQSELSGQLNVSQGTLSNWERGEHDIDNQSLARMADIFSVTTDYILGRTNESNGLRDTSPGTIKNAPTVDGESVLEKRIGFYGETKKYITDDDLDDIAAVMRAKAVRNKQKAMQDDDIGEN